jgi:PAS domain S-box-containing protein
MAMERLLQQMMDEAPDALLVADRQGIIRYWNRGAELMFQHPASGALGKSLDLIIPENLRGRHWEGFHRVMATGETKYNTGLLTSPGVRRDGSRLSLEFSMVLLRDESGAMAGCAAVMRDVTERWQREKELKERLKACEEKLAAD